MSQNTDDVRAFANDLGYMQGNGPELRIHFCKLADEIDAARNDALLGRFVRRHMVELDGGWQIAKTFIPGAPSIEDVTAALNAEMLAR